MPVLWQRRAGGRRRRYVFDTALTLSRCTLSENSAGQTGGGVFWLSSDALVVDHAIIAFSSTGEAVWCGLGSSVPQLSCTNLHGNAGGDWTGCFASQLGLAGNLSADPRFCGAGDLTLDASSPCAPTASACGQIGAMGVGCSAVSVTDPRTLPSSWGSVKAGYR